MATCHGKKTIKLPCNRLLSRGIRLVIVESVLESILIYLHNLTYIPKGILEKNQENSLKFLWSINNEKEGIPLVKWQVIVQPKEMGRWDLKNIPLFEKALVAKSV